MGAKRLFGQWLRTDSRPAWHGEPPFSFLDRRAGALWDRVRDHLEDCYVAFPDDHKRGLVGRLRDPDQRQHLPAWWELYVYTLFDRLKYEIEIHPDLPSSDCGDDAHPDFLVTKDGNSMYVEAAVVFNDDLKSDAWNWVCNCVNDAKNPGFMVELTIPVEGKLRPRAEDVQQPLERWLAGLDADQALVDRDAGRPLPRTQLPAKDWELSYTAVPVSPDRRGLPGRLIALYPIQSVDFVRDVKQLRKTLKAKGSKYRVDKPLLLAVTSWNSLDEPEVREALFSRRSGYWRQGGEARGGRISGVLFRETMRPWSNVSKLPKLWANPRPLAPLPAMPAFARDDTATEGLETYTESPTDGAQLFGLSPQWPYEG